MHILAKAFGFLHWVGISHFINLLFIGFLFRSGLEILSAHPKLYWNDSCTPGSAWLELTRKKLPQNRPWTSADEETSFSSWIAMPGHNKLGLGRHWHFFSVIFWVVNGLIYVALLFGTGEWSRLLPTSWEIFPSAARDALSYLHFTLPPSGKPYNALQQLAYSFVVFILSPLVILTGLAMSPAIAARFPRYLRLFGGRQPARSIHFLALIAYLGFLVIHVVLVAVEDFPRNMDWIVHGTRGADQSWAVVTGVAGLVVVIALHFILTSISLRHPRQTQRVLGAAIDPLRGRLLGALRSRQHYSEKDISPYFRVNGVPPRTEEYQTLAQEGFRNWTLRVKGLVKAPLEWTLNDLHAMPQVAQITEHHCIQGWSAVARWDGVPLSKIIERAGPLPSARYVIFWGMDRDEKGQSYYEAIDLATLGHSQAILALRMNGAPLTKDHGAPCRLRAETLLGYKMVKYLSAIEFVSDLRSFGQGYGGYREDKQYYGVNAQI